MSEPIPPAPTPAPAPAPAAPTETSEEKWKRRQFYLSLVSSVVLIFGGLGSIYQYTAQQKKLADEQVKQQDKELAQRETQAKRELAQREKEAELREREIALLIYREKKEAYALLLDAATEVMIAKNRRDVEDKAPRFYGIYYGRVHIIPELDQPVQTAKNGFKKKLDEYLASTNPDKPLDVFNSQLNDIASACRDGLDCHKLNPKEQKKEQTKLSPTELFQTLGPKP